jgi:hypothetical protein
MPSRPAAKRVILRVLIVALVAGGWSAVASFFFAYGIGHPELLTFPYLQWFDALGVAHEMLWWPHSFAQVVQHPLAWLVLSAIGPTALVLAAVLARLRRQRKPQALYGDSGWATPAEMADGDIQGRSTLP